MNYVWDLEKAASNLEKHGIHFADTVGVLEDEQTLSIEDPGDYGEERFVSVGMDYLGRILTIVFTYRNDEIRLISARKATKKERSAYEKGTL